MQAIETHSSTLTLHLSLLLPPPSSSQTHKSDAVMLSPTFTTAALSVTEPYGQAGVENKSFAHNIIKRTREQPGILEFSDLFVSFQVTTKRLPRLPFFFLTLT